VPAVPEVSARELSALLGGELVGDPDWRITRIGTLQGADSATVSFLSNPKYVSQLAQSAAGCVLVAEAQRESVASRPSALICADPYLAFARLTQWWAARTRPSPVPGIHASAVVDPTAEVDASACIGPLVVIGARTRIGAHAVVGAHGVIGDDAVVGDASHLHARVTLGERCVIGQRCILHSGAVVGSDGFGFAPDRGHWEKIEQLGAVRIGDDVEIGANSCIDRGALEDTVLEDGVKLDNLVQIAHNVQVGAHTAMAGCVGVAGSARIGAHCTVGGGAIVLGHLQLVDHVHISAATVVTRSILKPGQYSGVFPFDDNASWEKNAATLRQLHALRDRLRALEKKTI
jgi:UDP-3-O-[3-hydroxymyristoyl] glucosamine N-acyltransferase